MTETFPSLWWEEEESSSPPIPVNHFVSAIVVSRNGAKWLPISLSSLEAQTRPVDRWIGVDVMSTDDSSTVMSFYHPTAVIELHEDASQAKALAIAESELSESEGCVEWLWLLHDDSAVATDALEHLLNAANHHPEAGIVGCKVVDWSNPSHVLEVGISVTEIGTRYTGLEHGERDQGQHDLIHEVHATSNVGMLVRRDVWRALNGFSPALRHFRTEVDFCWRTWSFGSSVIVAPAARVRHVAATARAVRNVSGRKASAHYIDRQAGISLVLARTPKKWQWLRSLLILIMGVVRSAGYLVVQDLRAARDEWRATLSGVSARKPISMLRSAYGPGELPWGVRPTIRQQLSHAASEFVTSVQNSYERALDVMFPHHEDVSEVSYWQATRAALRRPGSLLAFVLIILGIFNARSAFGTDQLFIPSLGAVPSSGVALWSEYVSAWHPVGLGSFEPAHPMLAFVGAGSVLTWGNASAFVVALCALGPWLAGLSLHLSLRSVVPHSPTRVWLAFLYGLSPIMLGAAAGGSVGVVLAGIAIPVAAVLLRRSQKSWRAAALGTFPIAILASVWPATWIVSLIGLIAIALQLRLQRKPLRGKLVRWSATWLWSVLLLAPWSISTLTEIESWFAEFGVVASPASQVWQSLFATGTAAIGHTFLWSIGLLIVAILSLVDTRTNALSKVSWAVIQGSLVVALVGQIITSRLTKSEASFGLNVLGQIVLAGLVLCLAASLATVRVRLTRSSFGWRQITTALAVLAVALLPLNAFVSQAIARPLDTKARQVPAVDSAMLRGYGEDFRLRTLMLRTSATGTIVVDVLDGKVRTVGDSSMMSLDNSEEITNSITSWLTGKSVEGENPLAALGIGYVAVPAADPLVTRVSGIGSLTRLLTARNETLLNVWEVSDVTGRVLITSELGVEQVFTDLPASPAPVTFTENLPRFDGQRQLILRERYSDAWVARVGTRELVAQPGPWMTWNIPANVSGELTVRFEDTNHQLALTVAFTSLISVLLVIAPRRRNSYRDEWLDE